MGRFSLSKILAFEECELDLGRYELRRAGRKVKLERQPLDILLLLVERPGELITREEIRSRLWTDDVFVDDEQGINNGIRKIRVALGDDSEEPRYVETVVGRGYRFKAQIRDLTKPAPSDIVLSRVVFPPPEPRPGPSFWRIAVIVFAAVATVTTIFFVLWIMVPPPQRPIHFIRSIAILPLQNLSGDSNEDYFADAMTDELNTNLARIHTIRVVSRTSMLRYRNTHKSIPEIARELNVDSIIEGSIVRSGDKVRITTQLIDAHTDTHLWAQSYERKLDDLLEVQDSIALDIASQVRATLTPAERQYFTGRAPIRPNAYEDYLRGRNELSKQNPDAIKKGAEYFQRAIEDDPQYARAYAGLADAYSLLANYQGLAPSEAFPRARVAATKALALDPEAPEAHEALALVRHHFDWDWSGAEQEYKRATELQPNFANAHQRYAWFLSDVGRHDQALQEILRAQELDPTSIVVQTNLGRVLYRARRYDEAITELRRAVALDPQRMFSHIFLGMAYDQKGSCAEALSEFRIVQTLSEGRDGTSAAHAEAVCGKSSDARKALKNLTRPSADQIQDWFYVAGVFAALGEKDRAFEWLDQAVQNHDFFLTEMKEHPIMDPLRSDPRFNTLIKKVGFPN
ncbi:MAG: Adenylate cyclase [Candidatus Sulfotelmatobacter sp.]|nr:Adenylate cyclase [Candidatus Sulfotelmatobacter sp.]